MMLLVSPTDALRYADAVFLFTFLSLVYVTLVYYFHKIMGNERGSIEFKNEVKAIIFNVILFVAIVSAWSVIEAFFSNGIVPAAQSKLDELIIYPKKAYSKNSFLIPYFSILSSLQGSSSFAIWGFQIGRGVSFDGISIALNKLLEFNANLFSHILSLYTLKTLLSILQFFSILFFLPVGIMFRAFPLTRRLGSTMVAISLGAGIMLPIAIFFTVDMTKTMLDDSSILGYDSKVLDASERLGDFIELVITADSLFMGVHFMSWLSKFTKILYLLDLIVPTPIIGQISQATFSGIDLVVKGLLFSIPQAAIELTSSRIADDVYDSDYFLHMGEAILALNVGLVFFYFTVTFSVLAAIRAISIALGGEFFLYGVSGII